MQIRKVIDRTYSKRGANSGTNIAGSISAVIAANAGEKGSVNSVSSQSRVSIVQRGGESKPSNGKAK
jgi:hypothetical protein